MTQRDTRTGGRAGAILVGIGVMAAVDEIVFHQLLQWHHFYDASTPAVGIVADGLLHTAELIALVGGFVLLLRARQRQALHPHLLWSGVLIGAGGFQLFDGLVNHKALRLHQIRYGVDLLPYDLAWNVGAAVILVLGVLLARRARRQVNR